MTTAALFTAHQPLARAIARHYRVPGQEPADTLQEALIALWQACRQYRPELGAFPSFATVVIHRDLQDSLTRAYRGKQLILTDAVREHDAPSVGDACSAAIQRERVRLIVSAARELPDPLRLALHRIVNGAPYAGKADDNHRALVRRKLKAAA